MIHLWIFSLRLEGRKEEIKDMCQLDRGNKGHMQTKCAGALLKLKLLWMWGWFFLPMHLEPAGPVCVCAQGLTAHRGWKPPKGAMSFKALGIYRAQIQIRGIYSAQVPDLPLQWLIWYCPVFRCTLYQLQLMVLPACELGWPHWKTDENEQSSPQGQCGEALCQSRESQLSPAGAEWNVWVNCLCLHFEVKTTSQGPAALRNNKTSSTLWYGGKGGGSGRDLCSSRGLRKLHLEKRKEKQ